jgi:hypothetical protein
MADVWFTAQATPGASSTVSTVNSTSLSAGALSNNVSGLANAISAFNHDASTPISTTIPQNLGGTTSTAQIGLLSASTVKSLSALSSYNANGQAITASSVTGAQISAALDTSSLLGSTQAPLAIPTSKKKS